MSPQPDPVAEELRIALALNGGVGLAIWMGGVADELERLVSRRGPYDALLTLTASEPRIDVISGSSAGGINGALLAMAIAHNQPLAGLRSLWVEDGDLSQLLRDPFSPTSPSLLRGDEYFLPQLRRAFAGLFNPNAAGRRTPAAAPIVLSLTTTLLDGEANRLPDDFGTVINDVTYKAKFVFRRGPQTAPGDDPFADPDVVDRLALAARSSASFPGAFEASFVPVTEPTTNPARPAMGAFVTPTLSGDRFVVDGGVLDNKPLADALDDIYRQRADSPVRRVLAYIVPDPGTGSGPAASQKFRDRTHPPSAGTVAVASLMTLPRYQSIGEDLVKVRDRNRAVEEQRRARASLVGEIQPAVLARLATDLFGVYATVRKDSSIGYIVEQLSEALAAEHDPGLAYQGRRQWLYEVLDAYALPWIPTAPPAPDNPELSPEGWHWGTRAVELCLPIVLNVLRDAQQLAALAPPLPEALPNLWHRVFDVVDEATRLRATDRRFWADQAKALPDDLRHILGSHGDLTEAGQNLEAWFAGALEGWAATPFGFQTPRLALAHPVVTMQAAAGILARDLAQTLAEAGGVVAPVLEGTQAVVESGSDRLRQELADLTSFLLPPAGPPAAAAPDPAGATLVRLLSLHVVTSSLAGSDVVEQEVELIQISGNTPSAIGGPEAAVGKLAGIQLGHFGAFYRQSWRANDWMQGRLDGAARLAQAILSPARLRTIRWQQGGAPSLAAAVADRLAAVAWGEVADPARRAWLEQAYDAGAVTAELAFLDHPEIPPPEAIPACVRAVAARLQLDIILEELPLVAQAALQDEADGAKPAGPSATFARQYRNAAGGGPLEPATAITLFRGLHIGEETVADDMPSDLFSATVSQLLATSASVLTDQHLPFGFLKNVLRAIRGPLLLLYLMVRNATSGRAGAMLNAAILTAGTLVVGIDLLTSTSLPGILVAAGSLAFVAGLLMILLNARLKTLRVAIPVVAVLGVGALLVWIALQQGWRAFLTHQRVEAVAIILLVAVLVSVGTLRGPRRAPALPGLPRGARGVSVAVDGTAWTQVRPRKLRSAAAEETVFALKRGRVVFGDGTHGRRPPAQAAVTVGFPAPE